MADPTTTPQERAADLLVRMMNDIERQLRDAPDATRASLILKFAPLLTKQAEEVKVDNAIELMREELDAMRVEIRDALLNRPASTAPPSLAMPPTDG